MDDDHQLMSNEERDEIVHHSVDESRESRYRKLVVALFSLSGLLLVLLCCVGWYAYNKSQNQVAEGEDLAVQLQELCDNPSNNISVKGRALCKKADEIARGSQGAIGPQGPQGVQGIPGETGAQGPIGPQGPKGNPGNNGSEGTSGEPGEVGASGEPGATGAQGPAGEQGPQGETGAQGPDGESAYPFTFQFTVDNVVGSTTYNVTCRTAGEDCVVTESD